MNCIIISLNVPTIELRYSYNIFPDEYGDSQQTVQGKMPSK